MISHSINLLPGLVLALLLKTGMYYGIFRWQSIPATALNCIVIAGSGVLLTLLPLYYLPFAFIPMIVFVIALATYLCSRFTGIPYFPNTGQRPLRKGGAAPPGTCDYTRRGVRVASGTVHQGNPEGQDRSSGGLDQQTADRCWHSSSRCRRI